MKTKILALVMLCMMAMTLLGGVPVSASGTNILPGDSTNTFAAEVFEEGETSKTITSGIWFNNGTWLFEGAEGTSCTISPGGFVMLNQGASPTGAYLTSKEFKITKGAAYKLSFNMNMSSGSYGNLTINVGIWNKSKPTEDGPSYPSVALSSRQVPKKAKEHWDIFFVLPDSYNADRMRLQFVTASQNKPYQISNLTLTPYTGDEFVWYATEVSELYESRKYCGTAKNLTNHTVVTNFGNTYVKPEAGRTYTVTRALPDVVTATDDRAILLAAQYKGNNPTTLNHVQVSSSFAPEQIGIYDYVRKITMTGVKLLADSESFRILKWNNLADMVPLS